MFFNLQDMSTAMPRMEANITAMVRKMELFML